MTKKIKVRDVVAQAIEAIEAAAAAGDLATVRIEVGLIKAHLPLIPEKVFIGK